MYKYAPREPQRGGAPKNGSDSPGSDDGGNRSRGRAEARTELPPARGACEAATGGAMCDARATGTRRAASPDVGRGALLADWRERRPVRQPDETRCPPA